MRSRRPLDERSTPLDDAAVIEPQSPLAKVLVLGCTACVAALIALAVREGTRLLTAPPPQVAAVELSQDVAEKPLPQLEVTPAGLKFAPGVEHVELAPMNVEAEPLFKLPRARGRDRAARLIRIGRHLLRKDQFSRALRFFERAAELAPRNAEAWYGVALCDFELEHYPASNAALAHALAAQPMHPMTNVLAGFVAQDKADFRAAREHYDRYLDVEPNGAYSDELVSVIEQLPRDDE